jgi:hypothetical protein
MPLVNVILGAALTVHILIFFLHAYQALAFPYQLDYGEGPILQIALRVARGGDMYPPITEPPYLIASYMPLYYLLSALGVKLTGPTFLFGRLLSLVGAVAIAIFAALIVWDHTKHRFSAFLAGGLILAMPHFMVWSTLMRVDVFALALSVVGFYLFTRGRRPSGIAFFALAPLARRTTVAAMAAAFLAYAKQRGLRPAARAFAAQILAILLLVAAAVLLTRGGLYHQLYLHTATSVGKAWTWEQLRSLLWVPGNPSPLKLWPAYFIVTVVAAVWSAFHRPSRLLLLYFLLAGVIFLTGGRIGSAHNYLLEPTAIGAMMFGVMYAVLSRQSGPGRVGIMLIAAGLIAQMAWTVQPSSDPEQMSRLAYTFSILQPRVDPRASQHVVDRIRDTDGEVLCEDTGLSLLAGEEPPLMPFEFTMMARAGALDPTPVFNRVRRGGYPLIVLRFNPLDPREVELHTPGDDWKAGRWPDGIISGVIAGYRLDKEVGPYFLFVPNPRPVGIP